MRFRCEQCSTEYSIPDEAVARATRARCPRCKHSQALSAGGIPLSTPPGGKQIGRVAITTLTVEPEPEPQPEPELFGELEWESESQLEFVVGRSHVQFDGIPPAPPSVPPVSPPSAAKSAPLQPSSSAPVEWNEATGEYPAGGDGRSPDPGATKADAWPETESSDPWKRTPLPPLQESLSPARPAGAPAARPPTPPAAAPPAPVSPITSGGHRRPPPPTPVPSSAPRPTSAAPSAPPARPAPASATPRQTGSTTAVSPTPAPAREPCAACGGKLTDADDLASGVCGACRARTAAALGRPLPTSAPTPTPLPSGPIPIELNTVDVAPRTPTPPPRPRRALRAMPEPEHRGRVWMLLGALVVAAVISAALWYLRVRPDPGNLQRIGDEVIPRPKKKPVAQGKLPEGLEARLASWKAPAEPLPMPDLLASARADLARDTEPSDLAAEKALETALLQESRNVEALGLWLEAIARGRGQQLAASDLAALIRLGESALEELGRQPPLEVGLASLLLVRGSGPDVERARSLGQAAVDASAPPPPAGARASQAPPPAPPASWGTRARLVLAEAYATSSAALALSLLQEVHQRDPAQRRVFNVRAAAHDAVGSPRAAVADLQGRLALDPDEPRTALALARLFGQVGETAPARRIYDRLQASPATQDGVAVIDMAALRAGPEHAPAEAVKLLSRAIQRGRLAGTDLLRAQVTLARLARAAGDLPAAAQAVTAALSAAPDDVLAHVQGLLVDLDRGAPEQAAAHLPAVLGHLGDAGLAALLEGRVRAAQQRWQAA
ncbi:MAG: zinc-ribbon domain-containing protein, partial [Myxococcaceae bacterium]